MSRLFIALALPESLKCKIFALASEFPDLKWVPRQSMHLTLRFIGEAAESQELHNCLRRVKFMPFSMNVYGLGLFDRGSSGIIWAGVQEAGQLFMLWHKLDNALASAGINLNQETFSPHITLCRVNTRITRALKRAVQARREENYGAIVVNEFVLFRSILRPTGAIHQIVESFAA